MIAFESYIFDINDLSLYFKAIQGKLKTSLPRIELSTDQHGGLRADEH